jgi:hypothetical protein
MFANGESGPALSVMSPKRNKRSTPVPNETSASQYQRPNCPR